MLVPTLCARPVVEQIGRRVGFSFAGSGIGTRHLNRVRRYEDKEPLTIEAAFADTPKAAWDSDARIEASDLDGVVGEVVFPTIAVRLVETDIASVFPGSRSGRLNSSLAGPLTLFKLWTDITRNVVT